MITKDSCLVAIAEIPPANKEELAEIPELSANAVKRYAQPLLNAIQQARSDDSPPAPIPALERGHSPWLKALKELVRQRAELLNMPAPLLAQARTLESLVVAMAAGNHEVPQALQGWRESVIGTPLMAELRRLADP